MLGMQVLVAPLRLFRFTYLRATLLLLVIWFSQCYGLVCMKVGLILRPHPPFCFLQYRKAITLHE